MNRFFRLIWSEARSAWVPAAEIARGRRKRSGRAAVAATLVLGALGGAAAAQPAPPPVTELPRGGHVVAGQATIAADGALLHVDQSTARAAIDWSSFNVGSAAAVEFDQPSRDAATLNRVLDSDPSRIFGKITAPGQVFLTNPNGVYFGKSATVDVGGLAATTHSIDTAEFMAGRVVLERDGATGSVVNDGTLRATLGGYIALLAPEVRNAGVIVAKLGTVALAAGESFTLTFEGAHLADLTATRSAIAALVENKSAVIAPGGRIVLSAKAIDALQGGVVRNTGTLEATGMSMQDGRIVLDASSAIENGGTIDASAAGDGSAAGGRVELTAATIAQTSTGTIDVSGNVGGSIAMRAADDVSLQGVVRAASLADGAPTAPANVSIEAAHDVTLQDAVIDASGERDGGRIVVTGGRVAAAPDAAGSPPTISLSGSTELRASGASGAGGSVSLSAARVGLFDASAIDATGAAGGGDVRVGGGFHGEDPSVANARQVFVGRDAHIDASATQTGDGGDVAVWSDDSTRFDGTIAARGGAAAGDGGFVEVSGKGSLDFRGNVDTLASRGHVGTLLLDPYDLTIASGGDTNVTGGTPFDATGTGSVLSVTTLQNALAGSDVTVTTGSGGGEPGTITVANTVGWFSDHSLTLEAASTITVANGVSLIAAGDGDITLTSSGGNVVNDGTVRTYGGDLAVNAAAGGVSGTGSYNVAGAATFDVSGDIALANASNKFTGAVALLSSAGQVQFNNSQATLLQGATSGAGGVSIVSGGSITTAGSPSGIDTSTGSLSIATASGTNGSIVYTGPVSVGGTIGLAADGNGAISMADIDGDATFSSVAAGGAITLGDADTGDLTFDSAGGNALSGTAGAGGQASGTVAITGTSITLDDPFVTKGGNLTLTATSGAVTAGPAANITTTANTDTGTASGTVTVTAADGITLQGVVTAGADNSVGVGSNAAAVTLTSAAGDVSVGAITTSGGAATSGATSNRNGGNAGNIVIGAPAGSIRLNGDLNAIGGAFVGTATKGLGGYIDMENAVVLTADRSISSGETSGDVEFKSTVDSDGTARSLSITAGVGSVTFFDTVGGSSPLSSLTVASSTATTLEGDVTTNAAGGVAINASTIHLGDDSVANGSGAVTIDTSAGNGTVNLNASSATYLDDAVTFTRGTGGIGFSNYLYSKSGERNDLTFDGANGGAIVVGLDVGGGSASAFGTTALGDILVSSATDLSFGRNMAAGSLVSLGTTGHLSLGCNSCQSFFDGVSGYRVATTGTANNVAGDENILVNSYVTLSDATAPISISAPNGNITFNYAYIGLTTAGGDLTLDAGGSLTLPGAGTLASGGGLVSLSGVGVTEAVDATVNAGSGKIRVDGGGAGVTLNGVLQTTDADTNDSPAVLITDASAVSLRSVTAQTGTLQVGLVGAASSLAASQS